MNASTANRPKQPAVRPLGQRPAAQVLVKAIFAGEVEESIGLSDGLVLAIQPVDCEAKFDASNGFGFA
jgi:hypothetical protein